MRRAAVVRAHGEGWALWLARSLAMRGSGGCALACGCSLTCELHRCAPSAVQAVAELVGVENAQ